MQCNSCGSTLPPGMATCPTCGAPTPPVTSASSPYGHDADMAPHVEYSSLVKTPVATSDLQPPAMPSGDFTSPVASETQETAYGTAQPPPYPTPQQPQPAQQSLQPPQSLPAARTILLIVLALLVIGEGGGLVYYTTVFYPSKLHTQATAIAQTVVAQIHTTSSGTTPQDIYTQATSGSPVINDLLNNQEQSFWSTLTQADGNGGCAFRGGAYHVREADPRRFYYCTAAGIYSNFAFQVQMTILTGDDGGIVFRLDRANVKYYRLRMYQDGAYDILIYTGNSAAPFKVLQQGHIPTFNSGPGQSNLITLIARNTDFYLFVNKKYIATAIDSSYSLGQIGLAAGDYSHPAEVAFNNAQVWNL
jgi:hypothetical protein